MMVNFKKTKNIKQTNPGTSAPGFVNLKKNYLKISVYINVRFCSTDDKTSNSYEKMTVYFTVA